MRLLNRCHGAAVAVALISLGVLAFQVVRVVTGPAADQFDFGWFYYAWGVVRNHLPPAALYDLAIGQQWMAGQGYHVPPADQYVYPPHFAVFFSWLAAFPLPVALTLWNLMSVTCYLVSLYLIVTIALPGKGLVPRALLVSIGLWFKPYFWDLKHGNSDWLIFFLVSAAVFLRHRDRRWLAGIPLGLAIAFKLTPAVLLFFALIRRDWKLTISTLCTGAVATVITWLTIGAQTTFFYLTWVGGTTESIMHDRPAPWNSSIKGVLIWLNASPGVRHVAFLVWVLLFGALLTLVIWRTSRMDLRTESALATTGMVLFSPMVEPKHFLFILIPLCLLLGQWLEQLGADGAPHRRTLWAMAAAMLVIFVTSPYGPVGPLLDAHFPGHSFVATLVLVALCLSQFNAHRHQAARTSLG